MGLYLYFKAVMRAVVSKQYLDPGVYGIDYGADLRARQVTTSFNHKSPAAQERDSQHKPVHGVP